VKSCLCRVDREAAARDVIKLLLTDRDPSDIRRTDRTKRLMLTNHMHITLHQSLASESCIIYGCQGNSLLYQMGVDMMQHDNKQSFVVDKDKPTVVQLSIVLLRLREQVSVLTY